MESQISPDQTLQADLRQYISLLWRWAWLIVLAAVLAGGAAYITSKLQDPVYQSTTTMLINEAPSSQASEYTAILTSERLARTYSEMLTKRPVLDEVYKRLGLEDEYKSAELIGPAITVQLVRDTQLIELSVEQTNPELAAMMANTVVDVFVEQNQALQASRYVESKNSLEEQLTRLDGQIHNTVISIDGLGEISEVSQQRNQLQIQLAAYEQVYQSIVQSQVAEDVQIVSQSEIDQQLTSIQDQIIEIGTFLQATDNLVEKSLYEAKLKAYQQTYQLLLQDLMLRETNSTEASSEQLIILDQRISEISKELVDLGGSAQIEIERDRLEANLTQYRQSYNNLLQSYEQVRLSEAQATSNVVQVEPAEVPKKPIRPRILMNTALAAVVGGMLAVGAIFLMEALDDTIKSPDDVNRFLNLPILGTILQHESENGDPVTSAAPRSPSAEAFRSLRTNIRYASVDMPIHSLLVTSSSASEGKSTIASNLATVLAQGGDRTILIDADLRRPKQHQYLNLANQFGLSSFFVIQALFETPEQLPPGTIQTSTTEGLSVITSGKRPPNPSELLASEKMVNLLNLVSEDWEIVIVDSPPVLAVTDSTVLATRVDGVVLVVKPGETKVEAARQAVQQLRRVGANILGVILNGVDPRSSRYGYYYRYEYYYDQDGVDDEGQPADTLKRLPGGANRTWIPWAALATLVVLLGGWYATALIAGSLPAWLGGRGTLTPTPTLVSSVAEKPEDAVEMRPSATPTLHPTVGGALSEPVDELDETPLPSKTPTITLTPLPPTPGPGLMTPFGPQQEYILHQVKFGDNLANLASNNHTDRDVIMAANGLVPNQSLQPDQVIVILPWKTDSFDVIPLSVLFVSEATKLNNIAAENGVTSDEIRKYNQLGQSDTIPGGRWLIFPKREVIPTLVPTIAPTADLSLAIKGPFGPNDEFFLHRVDAGQSVPFIADLYLTTQEVIRAANRIQNSIRVGDVLVIEPEVIDTFGAIRFSVIQVEQEISIEDFATEVNAYPSDIILYNDLLDDQMIAEGSWLIYPTP